MNHNETRKHTHQVGIEESFINALIAEELQHLQELRESFVRGFNQ